MTPDEPGLSANFQAHTHVLSRNGRWIKVQKTDRMQPKQKKGEGEKGKWNDKKKRRRRCKTACARFDDAKEIARNF